MEIRYDYGSAPTIRRFARSRARVRGLVGPFGSGKSSGCIVDLVRMGQEQTPGRGGVRRTRFAVVRNTYQQLRDTTIKTVHHWLPPENFGRYLKHEHNYTVTAFPGVEMEIMFRALDRPDHVGNLLSLELTAAWVNEAREVPWPIIEALDGRINRFPPQEEGGATRTGIIMDTNPPDTDSDWYRVFEEQLTIDGRPIDPGYFEVFRQPSGLSANAENLPNLPRNYYEDLARGKGQDYIDVYIHGNYGYVKEHKAVYDDYNDTLHCTQEASVTKGVVVHRGWDFGLTPACVFSQLLPSGRWVIFDELVATEMGIDKFTDQVLRHCGQHLAGYTFADEADPAGAARAPTDEKTCYQIMEAKSIKPQPGSQDMTKRLESVRKPLKTLVQGKPQLLINPRCRMLRKGFLGKYFFRRIHTGVSERYTDVPEKNQYSHPHDGLQYTATVLFGHTLVQDTKNGEFMRQLTYNNRGIV